MSEIEEQIKILSARMDGHDLYKIGRTKKVNHQMWYIMIVGTLLLLFLGYRTETNSADIRHTVIAIQESRYQACVIRLNTQIKFNATREDVGRAIVALAPDAPQAQKDDMMAAMIASKQLPLPVCIRP